MDFLRGIFIERIKRTPTIESFRFEPKPKIGFRPGQFLKVVFDCEEIGNPDLNKYLSFSSSPEKEYVEVTKRLSKSQFSERLKGLRKGDTVSFEGPLGNCIFRPEYSKIGFLIGGIGITPVISILEYIAEEKADTDSVLIYSNRSEEETAFKDKLDKWKDTGKNKIIYTVTETQPQTGDCIYTRIDKDMVSDKIPDIRQRTIFLFGPPGMVKAMTDICLQLGAGKDRIKAENFTGY